MTDNESLPGESASLTISPGPYTGSFTIDVESLSEKIEAVDFDDVMLKAEGDDTEWASPADDPLGVPVCPECDQRDAVQLSTGEWVCQAGCGLFEVSEGDG